jgi:hypothetical protein
MAQTFTWEAWRRGGQAPDRLELASAILAGAIGSLRAAGFGQEEILALFAETAQAPDRLGVALTRLAGGERRVG